MNQRKNPATEIMLLPQAVLPHTSGDALIAGAPIRQPDGQEPRFGSSIPKWFWWKLHAFFGSEFYSEWQDHPAHGHHRIWNKAAMFTPSRDVISCYPSRRDGGIPPRRGAQKTGRRSGSMDRAKARPPYCSKVGITSDTASPVRHCHITNERLRAVPPRNPVINPLLLQHLPKQRARPSRLQSGRSFQPVSQLGSRNYNCDASAASSYPSTHTPD